MFNKKSNIHIFNDDDISSSDISSSDMSDDISDDDDIIMIYPPLTTCPAVACTLTASVEL